MITTSATATTIIITYGTAATIITSSEENNHRAKITEQPTWSSANLRRRLVGSAPGVRRKISGRQQLESAKVRTRSNGGGSMYSFPSKSVEVHEAR